MEREISQIILAYYFLMKYLNQLLLHWTMKRNALALIIGKSKGIAGFMAD